MSPANVAAAPGALLPTGGGLDKVTTNATAAGAVTVNLASGNVHMLTLTGNVTLTLTGARGGFACTATIFFIQDGTGGRTVTWPGSVVWPSGSAPTVSTAPASATRIDLTTMDGGTTWYGPGAGLQGVVGPSGPQGTAGMGAASLWLENAFEPQSRTIISDSGITFPANQNSYFLIGQAQYSFTATKFLIGAGGVAAAGVTTCRCALHTCNSAGGAMVTVAATANNTNPFPTQWVEATIPMAAVTVGGRALPASYNIVAGSWYAIELLINATTLPTFYGAWVSGPSQNRPPRVNGVLTGRTDLTLDPVLTNANSDRRIWMAVIP